MDVLAHACEDCGGTGSVRVHSPQDYGVSFECELCEHCGGTGVDVEALQAAYRGAVEDIKRLQTALINVRAIVNGTHTRQDTQRMVNEVVLRHLAGGQ